MNITKKWLKDRGGIDINTLKWFQDMYFRKGMKHVSIQQVLKDLISQYFTAEAHMVIVYALESSRTCAGLKRYVLFIMTSILEHYCLPNAVSTQDMLAIMEKTLHDPSEENIKALRDLRDKADDGESALWPPLVDTVATLACQENELGRCANNAFYTGGACTREYEGAMKYWEFAECAGYGLHLIMEQEVYCE